MYVHVCLCVSRRPHCPVTSDTDPEALVIISPEHYDNLLKGGVARVFFQRSKAQILGLVGSDSKITTNPYSSFNICVYV